jgi:hypothetical protein
MKRSVERENCLPTKQIVLKWRISFFLSFLLMIVLSFPQEVEEQNWNIRSKKKTMTKYNEKNKSKEESFAVFDV